MATASMATLHEEPPPLVDSRSCGNNVVATSKVSAPSSLPDGNSKVSAPTSNEHKTVVVETTKEFASVPLPVGKSILSASFPLLDGKTTPSPDGNSIMSATNSLLDGNDTPSPVDNANVHIVTPSSVGISNVPTSIPLVGGNVWATNNMNKFSPTIESTNVFFKFQPSHLYRCSNGNVKGMIEHALQEISVKDFMSSQKDKIAPNTLVVNKGSVLTYYYDEEIDLKTARITTRTLKSAIENAYKGTREHRLVGVQDTNISYKAINGKEVAIWFDKILSKDAIDEVNLTIFKAISLSTEVGSIYGFPKPVRRVTWVYRLQKIVGFTRTNMLAAFVREGLYPTYFRIMFGALDTNALTNEIGEYARIILSLEEDTPHLTSIMVDTNRGSFPLALKVRDDTSDVFTSKFYPAQEENAVEPSKNPKHKTALCFKFRDNGFCPRNGKCGFAHGEDELREYQGNPKVGLPHGGPEHIESGENREAFPMLPASPSSLPAKVTSSLVVDPVPGLQLGDGVLPEKVVSVVKSTVENVVPVVQSSSSSDNDDSVSNPGSDGSMNADGDVDALMSDLQGVDNTVTQADDVDVNGVFVLSPKDRKKLRQRELKDLKRRQNAGFAVSKVRTDSTPSSPSGKVKNAVLPSIQSDKGRGSFNSPGSQRNARVYRPY